MREIRIVDLKTGLIPGVTVAMPGDAPYREAYFEWTASPILAAFKTCDLAGGTLRSWKSVPLFTQVETHIDAEMFYFLEGLAIMPFADIAHGQPVPESFQIVRIRPGTRLIIPAGKAHFVPIAEDDTPLSVVVVSPRMEAPRMRLEEAIVGI